MNLHVLLLGFVFVCVATGPTGAHATGNHIFVVVAVVVFNWSGAVGISSLLLLFMLTKV